MRREVQSFAKKYQSPIVNSKSKRQTKIFWVEYLDGYEGGGQILVKIYDTLTKTCHIIN